MFTYHGHEEKNIWNNAAKICHAMGRQLALPTSQAEIDEIFNDPRMVKCKGKGRTECELRGDTSTPFNDGIYINLRRAPSTSFYAMDRIHKMYLSTYGYGPVMVSNDSIYDNQKQDKLGRKLCTYFYTFVFIYWLYTNF